MEVTDQVRITEKAAEAWLYAYPTWVEALESGGGASAGIVSLGRGGPGSPTEARAIGRAGLWEKVRLVELFLARLSWRELALVRFKYFRGLPAPWAAKALGVSLRTFWRVRAEILGRWVAELERAA